MLFTLSSESMTISSKPFFAACFVTAIAALALGSSSAFAQMSVSIDVAPPPLPVYEQPACPGDGYLWAPGYWAYSDYGYYWVPGTWVQPPEAGLLWTPGYWGFDGNNYVYYPGYWGNEVGFYGGINYGYGYGGDGYGGGRWQDGHFFYNTAVNNVNPGSIHNRYADASFSRNAGDVSFNGGNGGVQAQPTAQQQQFASQRHIPATSVQVAHVRAASLDRGQLASSNGGKPATMAAASAKSYKRVAQQHVSAQPLTRQDSVKQQQLGSAKTSPAVSPESQSTPEKQAPTTSVYAPPAESHDSAPEPRDKPAATYPSPNAGTQPRPEPDASVQRPVEPQPRPELAPKPQATANAQPRPEAEAKPQPRPEAEAKPEARPESAGPGQSMKPQQ